MSSPSATARRIPGEVGVWVFILGDLLVFATFFLTYLFYRAEDPGLFERSQPALNQALGAANMLVLLLSSLLVATAVRAVHTGQRRPARRLFTGAVACGLAYIAIKGVEYHDKIGHDLTPSTNAFFLCYFALTGLHLLHVVLGIGVLTALRAFAREPDPTPRRLQLIESGACYWHVVDALWVLIFALLYTVQ